MCQIEVKNVTKRYNDQLAVDNISLNINEGDLFGLLGPNGAGKSTLISMICGLISIDKGDVFIDGLSIKKNPIQVKKLFGYVPQEIALIQNMSIKDNLLYFGRMYGLRGKVLRSKMNQVLEVVGLKEREKDKVKILSGGMKRRLNIACAILHDPKIMIMDEPTVGIDPQSRNHILEFTKKMNREKNTTIIYTSHYMEEIQNLCDHLVILDNGEEIIKGTKNEILRTVIDETVLLISLFNNNKEIVVPLRKLEGVKDVTLKENNIELIVSSEYNIENILKVLRNHNCKIKNIAINEPDLETVFLSLTGKNLRD